MEHKLTLTVKNLSVRYSRREILSGVSFDAQSGTLLSVIGENGCGKTTLLKALAGLVRHSGNIDITENGSRLTRKAVAYLPQHTGSAGSLSVFETVLLGLTRQLAWRVSEEDCKKVDRTLHSLNISRLAKLPLSALSGGQKQLVYMAQVFVSQPRVLLLDEPTSALDLRHQLIVMQAVQNYTQSTGALTISVIHDLALAARMSSKLLMLSSGGISAYGAPEDVLNPNLISKVYHVDAAVDTSSAGFLTVTPITAHILPGENDHTHDLSPKDL